MTLEEARDKARMLHGEDFFWVKQEYQEFPYSRSFDKCICSIYISGWEIVEGDTWEEAFIALKEEMKKEKFLSSITNELPF